MKKFFLYLLVGVVAGGCVHRSIEPAPAPSACDVKASIGHAQELLVEAHGSIEQIGRQVGAARTKAERIDHKATVILENWQ